MSVGFLGYVTAFRFNSIGYVASYGRMTMNDELGRLWKGSVVTCSKVLYR